MGGFLARGQGGYAWVEGGEGEDLAFGYGA